MLVSWVSIVRENLMHHIMTFVDSNKWLTLIYALSLLMIGYFVAKKISVLAEHAFITRFSRHHTLLIKRSLFYIIFSVFFIISLQSLGFKLSVLLGAAGVFTVAISFAAQTAVSNLISGIFLLFEHPFKIGDSVSIKGTAGVVDSIDLLSTKLKTSDNTLIRIPNETLIKSEITNLSYFPTRRIDLIVDVSYDCDLTEVKALLIHLADQNEHVLKKPAPDVILDDFLHYAVQLKLIIWTKTSQADSTKHELRETIKRTFDQKNIKGLRPEIIQAQSL